jgi:hypothetical protein
MPSAMSSDSEPVGMASISSAFWPTPSRMIEPLPKARSIWLIADSNALFLSIPPLSSLSTIRNAAA